MEDYFATFERIPMDLMCYIIGLLGAEDLAMIPFVSKNWYMTCKTGYFFRNHSLQARLNTSAHIMFCVPDRNHDFEDHTLLNGVDEGVICIRNIVGRANDFFLWWNPVTKQNFEIRLPNDVTPRILIRTAFCFNHEKGKFCLILMSGSPGVMGCSAMTIFSSLACKWSDVSIPIYEPALLFDKSINISGIIYWLSCRKDPSYDDSQIVVAYESSIAVWKIFKLPFVAEIDK
ncbi:hypothetical protein G2W53_027359 [Senna tora]|uniref:F-box domain-containing protein n=1 Tax=Senna tora TaxID=362788 RepID=A0A834TIW8_9FABA|nr:hypothetical protein G2W53_027359 [Senna tora]